MQIAGCREFRNQYGVYPRTVAHIAQLRAGLEVAWLVKVLWWLKQYPTDEAIKNQESSPSHFRKVLWGYLVTLLQVLPEV